jgi:hypothetical protein
VAASAELSQTATLEGKVFALEAEVNRLRKERDNEVQFTALRAELGVYEIPNLDAELRKHVDAGTAASFAAGIKQKAPPAKRGEEPQAASEDPALGEFLKKNPKADPARVRYLASVYATAPEDHIVRKYPLDRFLTVQMEMGS